MMNLIGKIGVSKIVMCGSCWEYGKRKGELQENREVSILTILERVSAKYMMKQKYIQGKRYKFNMGKIFYSYGYGQRRLH